MTRKTLIWLLPAIAIIAAIVVAHYVDYQRRSGSLRARLEKIVSLDKQPEISCSEVAASRPIVLLALGQSNAANHGSPLEHETVPVTLFSEGKCIKATDPLPGGTGRGASIWQRLPALLSMKVNSRPIVISVLAVDATSIEDWTGSSSPLSERLSSHLGSMRRLGLSPSLVLWQQGEADARLQTSSAEYLSGLDRLASILDESGSDIPVLLARSTTCRSSPGMAVRRAIDAKTAGAETRRFRTGPDTDSLQGQEFRYDGCHFNSAGQDRVARMWAERIAQEVPLAQSPR